MQQGFYTHVYRHIQAQTHTKALLWKQTVGAQWFQAMHVHMHGDMHAHIPQ